MPNIKLYESPAEGLSIPETGIQATAAAARRVGSSYNELAEATTQTGTRIGHMASSAIAAAGQVGVDFLQHREISAGAAALAKKRDQLSEEWDATAKNADPNDPTVAAKFREERLEPELDKFQQAFWTEGGQKWAQSHIASMREHMFVKTAADMSDLAGKAVIANARQMFNSWSNTAMRDPSSVPDLLSTANSSAEALVGSSPNLKGATAAKVRIELLEKAQEAIVKAGAIGAIQKSANPEAVAKAWGEKYPQFISGAELKTLEQNARQQIRAQRIDEQYYQHQEDKQKQRVSDAAEEGILQKLYSDDPDLQAKVSTKAIVNDPNLTRPAKERMINIVNREMKPETAAQTSNANYIGVLKDIRSGAISDVDPIYRARQDGKLNRADFNQALKDFTEYKSPQGEALGKDRAEFFKRYAPTIDASMGDIQSMQFGHHSALGLQKMYEAEKAARRMEEDLRKQGKDPHLLYDPSAPEFFGRNVSKYTATLQEAQAYQAEISKGAKGAKAPPPDAAFKPPPSWEFSPSRKQYRDPATGTVYDLTGKAVKP